jgi:hypothetical protein
MVLNWKLFDGTPLAILNLGLSFLPLHNLFPPFLLSARRLSSVGFGPPLSLLSILNVPVSSLMLQTLEFFLFQPHLHLGFQNILSLDELLTSCNVFALLGLERLVLSCDCFMAYTYRLQLGVLHMKLE